MVDRIKIRTGRVGVSASLSILFAAIVAVAFIVASSEMTRAERAMGSGVAYRVASELGSRLDSYLAAGKSLALALEANPGMGAAQTEAIAEGILAGNPSVIGVSTAPGAIIDRYYPAEEGGAWKGHDLLSNPERKDALLKAVELKTPVVTGPFEAVDGSSSIFLRYPVYSGGKLWGFSSLTVDFTGLLASLGLDERYPGIAFALADLTQPKAPRFLGGKELALNGRGASADVDRQGVAWRVYAAPAAGWADSNPFFYALFVSGLVAAVFLYLLLARQGKAPDRAAVHPESAAPFTRKPEGEPEPETKPDAVPRHEDTPDASAGLFPDLAVVEKKRGRAITFKGPAVKGDLFMPERLLTGWSEPLEGKEKGPAPAESLPQPMATDPVRIQAPAPVLPTVSTAPAPPQAVQRPAYLFTVEEEKPPKDIPILVVDDSEANRDIVGRMLSLRGYKADFAASGGEAIDLAATKSYKIVFMDSYMPGMDGHAATRILRAGGLSSNAFIVGMSAKIGAPELEKCKESGMDDLLSKPFTLKQLLAFLERGRP